MVANQTSIYYLVYTELALEILWVGNHIDHLKAKLVALNYNTLHCINVLLEVIAPEVVARLIASDLGIQYDESLNVLRDEVAWEYGVMIDSSQLFPRQPTCIVTMPSLSCVETKYGACFPSRLGRKVWCLLTEPAGRQSTLLARRAGGGRFKEMREV
jgi:hypothetical protein